MLSFNNNETLFCTTTCIYIFYLSFGCFHSIINETILKNTGFYTSTYIIVAFEDGSSLSYHNWGAAVSEVEVDVLTGETVIRRSDMLYDCGKSLNPAIDFGQAEGAFMMGVGFLLREELFHAEDGMLVSNGTWEYKIPTRMDVPLEWNIEFLKDSPFPKGILTLTLNPKP
jgi:xanthine dehydrogenase molybdopterin-binding subunit B